MSASGSDHTCACCAGVNNSSSSSSTGAAVCRGMAHPAPGARLTLGVRVSDETYVGWLQHGALGQAADDQFHGIEPGKPSRLHTLPANNRH